MNDFARPPGKTRYRRFALRVQAIQKLFAQQNQLLRHVGGPMNFAATPPNKFGNGHQRMPVGPVVLVIIPVLFQERIAMFHRIRWLLLFSMLACFATAPALPAQEKKEADPLAKKLEKKISLKDGIEANTPLQDALEFLSQMHDFKIFVNEKAFQAAGIQKVAEQPVRLKPVKDVALGKVLQMLLDQVGGTYKIDKGKVAIQPKK